MLIISVFGVTNVGKSTLMDALRHRPGIGLIEVGKEMRRRHPPDYFHGKAAMPETETEVWEIFDEQYAAARLDNAKVVVVDGQPRLPTQVRPMLDRFGQFVTCWLTAPREVLMERAMKRDSDPAKLELSMQRLNNDYIQLHDTLAEVLYQKAGHLWTVFTTKSDWLQFAVATIESWRDRASCTTIEGEPL